MLGNRLRKAYLSPVDTAWLRMELPTNLMMITGIFMFDEPLDFERVKSVIEQRLLHFERFRQRVIQPAPSFRRPYWENDPHFDINAHLHRIALPAPGDQTALEELVNDFMSTPLDFSKPLWHIHLVENYGNGCALLCRLHHSIGDGIALMKVLLNMTDDEADPSYPFDDGGSKKTADQPKKPPPPSLETALKDALRFAGKYSDRTKRIEAAKFGASSSAALAHLLLLSPDPKTPFKGDLGVRKLCTWTKPIPLADVKAVGRVTGGTVNDVLLSAVSGALGRYLHHRGEPAGGIDIRAVVPVNLRPAEEEPKLGNAFGLIFLSLPIGISDPLDRLEELKRRMDSIKGTPEAFVAFGILTAIGAATPEVEDIVISIFGKKATTVMTNVPGPREIRYFAGRPIRGLMFWVPQSGRLGLGVSILSYAGQVLVGIASDAGLVPDPGVIVQGIHQEFESLMELVTLASEADAEIAAND